MDPENQRKLQGLKKKKGMGGRISEKRLYSNIPYTNSFITKTVKLPSKELTLQKHRPEYYCSNKEAAERQHSAYPAQ